ncbi:MAG: tetratricopeptide repeat protein [Clostridia bacterium]|nr:tetratricopeptide repeat protein [Clostridia bacterium]
MNDVNGRPLSGEDYKEPQCLLNMHPEIRPIPAGRVIEKLDQHLSRNDWSAAERHLRYWLAEAESSGDARGRLTVLNEMIGLYRKMNRGQECLQAVADALALADGMEIGGTVSYGTTLINAATGYRAFGRTEEALKLYRGARSIYETCLQPDDERLGGLYNNMAVTLSGLKEYREAEALYHKAIGVMRKQAGGEPEIAVTLLNLADLTEAEAGPENGAERIDGYLAEAEALLDTEGLPRDGHYAFVCEKCAPVFGHYGWFAAEQELKRRAGEIYERA